ncbi:Acetate kinase [Hyella patelloides LEGE 07179]|uniref:Acetate kinase n=1 Tax=Hyella patelloides LEGE 07179 TaxID=945734 RepID=A0A563W3I5_9CYAN|nr:acetate kinase [Hyella patelloides]VEP18210.1 Acetate kinase [Hyella patelloides LEGE 07179]
MIILVLNAGSSSQKSCLYSLGKSIPDTTPEPLWEAHLDWTVAQEGGILTVKSNDLKQKIEVKERETALKVLLNTLVTGDTKVLENLNEIDVVGHRVVHGGSKYSQAIVITQEVKQAITDLIPLAPNHNPAHLEGINIIEEILPEIPQVAVFDTAFHTTIPDAAKIYPLPYEYYEKGIQRYGFHGTSHQYCANRTAQILQQPLESLKIVTCHLGNGCSLAAIKNGICVDTTMGFSPLEGLMMGTRCGSIDPQILIYMMQKYELDAGTVNKILNKESGLKGVSGISADMRTITNAIADGNTQAQLAFDIYLHRFKSSIGAMVASLNGIDVLVFTAGVGENSRIVREKTCAGLTYLGLQLDLAKNNGDPVDTNIAADDSPVKVLVIHTQEDWAIALSARSCIAD